MRVLVTGYGGMSGTFIAHDLAGRGFDVTALQRSQGGTATASLHETLNVIEGDLLAIPTLPPVDAIIHTASSSPGPEVDEDILFRNNTEATRRLVEIAKKGDVSHFIFFSSLSVFGLIDGPRVDEKTPAHDPDTYGASKAQAEYILAEAADHLNTLAFRLPAVVGPGALRRQTNWPTRILRKILNGEDVHIHHPHSPFNNVVHLADLADFIDTLLGKELKGFDYVTLASEGTISVREAVERLMTGANRTASIQTKNCDTPSFIISNDHAKTQYGYTPMATGAAMERFAREET